MSELNRKNLGVLGLVFVAVMGGNILRLFLNEVEGLVVSANEECTDFDRCYMHYKIGGKDGALNLIVGPSFDGWEKAFAIGDKIEKLKWSLQFCINGDCVAEIMKFEFVVFFIGIFLIIISCTKKLWPKKA